MNYITIPIFFFLFACNSVPSESNKVENLIAQTNEMEVLNQPIEQNSVAQIDSIVQKMKNVDIYKYPNLTTWGGISVIYYHDTLIKVESQYNAEFDYTANNYYIKNESITDVYEKKGSFTGNQKIEFQLIQNPPIDLVKSGYDLLEFIDSNFQDFTIVYD